MSRKYFFLGQMQMISQKTQSKLHCTFLPKLFQTIWSSGAWKVKTLWFLKRPLPASGSKPWLWRSLLLLTRKKCLTERNASFSYTPGSRTFWPLGLWKRGYETGYTNWNKRSHTIWDQEDLPVRVYSQHRFCFAISSLFVCLFVIAISKPRRT